MIDLNSLEIRKLIEKKISEMAEREFEKILKSDQTRTYFPPSSGSVYEPVINFKMMC